MEITKQAVRDYLKTLPTGYYLGKGINVTLTNDETSWFSPEEFIIGVSIHNVVDAALGYGKEPTEEQFETFVRSPLYHEVSHALRTPRGLLELCGGNKELLDIVNIAEDERIETLGAHDFLKVNFKECCKLLNRYDKSKTTFANARQEWFYLWRFRHSTCKEWLDRVNKIIKDYRDLTFSTPDYGTTYVRNPSTGEKLYPTISIPSASTYLIELKEFWDDVRLGRKTVKPETEEIKIKLPEPILTPDPDEIASHYSPQGILNSFHSEAITTVVEKIIEGSMKVKGRYGASIDGYSGKFDPRNIISHRKDYRWWTSTASRGNQGRYAKTKLNLAIDVSGSFRDCQIAINQIINAIGMIEKSHPSFSFDVIKMGVGECIAKKNRRTVHCDGGNSLDKDVVKLYKEVQDREAVNYNIMVADGDLWSNTDYRVRGEYQRDSLAAFNHPNCVIISDPANEPPLRLYCKKAKIIITNNYVAELKDNIIKALTQLVK